MPVLSPIRLVSRCKWAQRIIIPCGKAWTNRSGSAFGVTAYTAGITGVMMEFDVSMTVAVLGLSLNLLGIVFAPIITPHISERLGRSTVYLISLPFFSLFILGASQSQSFVSLAICRFFAGFFGGPCLVLIEGTFADCWRGHTTVTYYSILSLSSYIGAACGLPSSYSGIEGS
jgi:MFS transporter, DHA1 family, multidrug resistance protein